MALNNEIIGIADDVQKSATASHAEVLKLYKRNLDEIRQALADIYQRYTVDGELKISQRQRLKELKALETQLATQINALQPVEIESVTQAVTNTAEDVYYRSLYTLDKGLQGAVAVAPLNPTFAEMLVSTEIEGKTFSRRIWENTEKLAIRVKADIERALIQGQSPEKLARKIKSDFGATAYQSQRLINTETARAMTAAQTESYKSSGVVNYVMFDATLEDNTCDQCAKLDGKRFQIDDAPKVPQHPCCRCCLIPVVSGWTPTQKRENVKDPVTGEKRIIDYTSVDRWRESRGVN